MKVSVIVPAYNAETYIEEAVQSIIDTRYPSLEIIIIDDASSDQTAKVARGLSKIDSRVADVRLKKHKQRRGVSAARNCGIHLAVGNIITFLDADDRYYPNRFDQCIPVLQREPSIDGVFEATDYELLDKKDEHITWKILELERSKKTEVDDSERIMERLTRSNWHTNALTVRKSVFKKCGGFNEKLRKGQDLELWFRMSMLCRLQRAPGSAPVATYRRHAGNRTTAENATITNIDIYSSLLKWMRKNGRPQSERAFISRMLRDKAYDGIHTRLYKGDCPGAWRILHRIGRKRPTELLEIRFWGNMWNLVRRLHTVS